MTHLDQNALEAAQMAFQEHCERGCDLDQIEMVVTAYLSTITPAEVGGLVDAQTEARAIAARLREDISEEANGYRRQSLKLAADALEDFATALAAKDAELVARKQAAEHLLERALAAEAALAEARKVLEPFAALADIFDHHGSNRPREGVIAQWSDHRVGDRDITVEHLRAARRALTGGKNG